MEAVIEGVPLVPGEASGIVLATNEPLSFWGGYDCATGEIIDRAHPLSGDIAAGRVLVLPFSRGSSTSTTVLLEALRAGTAPAAIIVGGRDTFFALAAIVADAMFGRSLPVIAVAPTDLAIFQTGDRVVIHSTGRTTICRA
jgi:predicted aconitase with swiveling domain